ncbi:MAG: DUF6666 family protein [Pirellulales bacterium]
MKRSRPSRQFSKRPSLLAALLTTVVSASNSIVSAQNTIPIPDAPFYASTGTGQETTVEQTVVTPSLAAPPVTAAPSYSVSAEDILNYERRSVMLPEARPIASPVSSGKQGSWLSNTQLQTGFDAYKSIGDISHPPGSASGFMDSAGMVGGFNSGVGLGRRSIRGQIGGSLGIYDLKGRDTDNQTTSEQQGFLTTGIYRRSDIESGRRVAWGVVYDQFWASQWGLTASELYVGQFRTVTGYALTERSEIGIWSTIHTTRDLIEPIPGDKIRVRASNQTNLHIKRTHAFGGSTTAYVGGLDHADVGSWTLGLLGQAPLNMRTSLYGNSTFLFPSSASGAIGSNELQWNLSMGLVYSFGGKGLNKNISGNAGMPLLPVANNGNMLITN